MDIEAGIAKIQRRGTAEPDAVRFHVPGPDGDWDPVTWGEVLARSAWIARWLQREGVGHDDKVAVYATTRVEWAYCCPAIEACRAVFVPVYFSNTPDQTQYVVDHSDASVLFTELALLPALLARWTGYPRVRRVIVWDLEDEAQLAGLAEGLDPATREDVRARVRSLGDVWREGRLLHESDPNALARMIERRDDSDVAAIIYTSGTTGVPKGAMLSVANLKASAESWLEVLAHAFPPEGERRDILWLPVSHMSGWGILGQGTAFDYETWLSDPFQLLQILPEVRPTMLLSVPAYWEKLYALARAASDEPAAQHARLRELTGGSLTFLLSGGAGLKREIKEFFHAAGIQMIEGYGMTECSPNLTMNRLDDYDFESVGKPMPGVTLKLADDGEILVRGDNVFLGYYKAPEETAACFDEAGWFRTGDLGAWTDRGFLRFCGRKKEIIATSGGKKIGPAGIEARFAGRPCLEHVVLYGDERKYLTALVTLDELATEAWAAQRGVEAADHAARVAHPEVRALVQSLVDEVNGQLAPYETVKRIRIHDGHLSVAAGQLTPSLKVRRRRVWQDFGEALDALYDAG